jgi:DUF4097 and DUF4098 domain-containing protein YvlB
MKAAAVFILIFLPVVVLAETIRETRGLALPADGVDTLVVNCGAGSFLLRGADDRMNINVAAQIEVEEFEAAKFQKFVQDNVQLTLKKQGRQAIFQSDIKPAALATLEARINLTIEIPKKLNVKITDGSGPIVVGGLDSNLTVADGSGSIDSKDIIGEVRVDDFSGSIVIEDIEGNVVVIDRSGSIAIEYVAGDVQVQDGTGSILIGAVDGNVSVSDSSGSIDVQSIKKDVFIVIREGGSGEVTVEGVKGKITIRP